MYIVKEYKNGKFLKYSVISFICEWMALEYFEQRFYGKEFDCEVKIFKTSFDRNGNIKEVDISENMKESFKKYA